MRMNSILLVEDDPVLGKTVKLALELEGFEVSWVTSIKEAKSLLDGHAYSLAIFDLNLPDGHGLDLCAWTKEHFPQQTIIILTAQSEEEMVVRGLEAGARDYVRKPFGQRELLARIKAVLRQTGNFTESVKLGDLTIDLTKRQAHSHGKEVDLNRRQFDILYFFSQHQGRIVTRDMLLNHLGREGDIFDRTIDSHISQLRRALKKVAPDKLEIVSVYGVGYRFEVAS